METICKTKGNYDLGQAGITMKKLAIITTHPIQYNAPLFRLLAERGKIQPKIYYTWGEAGFTAKYDPGFKKVIEWDIPLLEGYEYTFCNNIARHPGSHHFNGIINPGLSREIRDWGADAVLVYGWSFKSHLACMRKLYGKIPVFFRGDSTLLDDKGGLRSFARSVILRWVYRHVNKVFFTGINNKAYFMKYGLKEEQLILAPHAVDNHHFMQPDVEHTKLAEDWKKELGILPGKLVLLFAGKLEEKKNPAFLLRLMQKIDSDKIILVIAGNGPLETELKDSAKADKRIIFLPFQNQASMPVLYRLADIFILPSMGPGETWGLAGNEAMACGLALMMSNKCGGAVDLIEEGKNGVLFSPGDISAAAVFISSVLKNMDKLKAMKQVSLMRIHNFTLNRVAEAIEKNV